MFERLFGGSISALERGLNAASLRNDVINNNIANAETPGFKSSSVEFESLLQDAVEGRGLKGTRTNARHIPIGRGDVDSVSAVVVQNNRTTMRADGNNVDIESEMTDLAKNSIYYSALVRKISGQINQLRSAIKG